MRTPQWLAGAPSLPLSSTDEKALSPAVEEVEPEWETDISGVSAYVSSPLFVGHENANAVSTAEEKAAYE